MKIIDIKYTPLVELEFASDEVRLLYKCSQQHYDGVCRMLSVPGPGAIINGLMNTLQVDDKAKCMFTFRELDLLCKVVEPYHGGVSREQVALFMNLKRALDNMRTPPVAHPDMEF